MPETVSRVQMRHHSSHWGAFQAHVVDGRLVGVEPFAKDPHPSPIIESIPDALYHESRVSAPMVRISWLERGPGANREGRGKEPFVPVSWDIAMDLLADELKRVKTGFGNESIFAGSYGWSSAGRFHHAKTLLQRFLNGFGGFTDQVQTYSNAAGAVITERVLGTNESIKGQVTTWDSIVENTELFLMFGGIPLKNTQVSFGGPGEHSAEQWLNKAKEAGVEFINIGPLRSDAPEALNAQWLRPRPNTDTALMLGLAHTLVSENLHDRDFLDTHCSGYEKFEAYLMGQTDGQPKDAAWAGRISDIPADTIRQLARRMASRRSMIMTNWSLQRGDHGEQPFWMTIALACILGQVGLPGGGFVFGYGSMGGMGTPRSRIPSPSLAAGRNPTGSFIPVARIADMLLQPGERYSYNGEERTYPDIKMIYWCGGNPFHHHQDLNRLIEAWRRPDTIVIQDPWWTPSARFADIVLPATTTLERNDIGSSSTDRFILAMEKAIDPIGQARNDIDIFSGLAGRLGFEDEFTEGKSEMEWLRELYEAARDKAAKRGLELDSFDNFWKRGHTEVAAPEAPYVYLEDFRADPEKTPLKTPSGKIEIYSETIEGFAYEECPPHPAWLEPAEWLGGEMAKKYPLHMISNQPRTRLHGQMDNGRISRASKIQDREPALIHPEDAVYRGIADGDVIRVFNNRGSILAGAVVSSDVMPGVIQISTGAWYDPMEPGDLDSLDKHGNPNVLTLDKGTSPLSQGPSAHTTLVEAERYQDAPPEITAHQSPVIAEA